MLVLDIIEPNMQEITKASNKTPGTVQWPAQLFHNLWPSSRLWSDFTTELSGKSVKFYGVYVISVPQNPT